MSDWSALPPNQQAVLDGMDIDTWQLFDEVANWAPRDLTRREILAALRGLQRRGLVWTRVSDAHGRTEWAITDTADELLAKVHGE